MHKVNPPSCLTHEYYNYMGGSWNGGCPKSSKSLDHDLVLKPMVTWGTLRSGNLHMIHIKKHTPNQLISSPSELCVNSAIVNGPHLHFSGLHYLPIIGGSNRSFSPRHVQRRVGKMAKLCRAQGHFATFLRCWCNMKMKTMMFSYYVNIYTYIYIIYNRWFSLI